MHLYASVAAAAQCTYEARLRDSCFLPLRAQVATGERRLRHRRQKRQEHHVPPEAYRLFRFLRSRRICGAGRLTGRASAPEPQHVVWNRSQIRLTAVRIDANYRILSIGEMDLI